MKMKHGAKNALALICAAMGLAPVIIPGSSTAEQGNISGTWAANGTRQSLTFGEGRKSATFKLAGHVNLKAEICGERDYWSECIGLSDSQNGISGLCIWRSLDGQEIYLELSGKPLSSGSSVTGKIVGGSQKAENMTGTLSFIWSTMSSYTVNNSESIGGFARDLAGTYQLP